MALSNTGFIMGGLAIVVPGITVRNYRDDPAIRIKMGEDARLRPPDRHVQIICLHSTLGAPDSTFKHPQTLLPGDGPSSDVGRALAALWGTDHRCAGAAIAIDFNRMVYCLADLTLEETYNAGTINERDLGIEYRQGRGLSEFYGGEIAAGRDAVDWLTGALPVPVQRQRPGKYLGKPIQRLAAGGSNYVGICGHRDQSDNRGAGDPGDYIMDSFADYQEVDIAAGEDLDLWAKRQTWLGFSGKQIDGIPGPKTAEALRTMGFRCGLWACPPKGLSIPASLRPIGS